MQLAFVVLFLAGSLGLSGCVSNQLPPVTADTEFGNRIEGTTPDGRETVTLSPADENTNYLYFPATYDSLNIRQALSDEAPTSPDTPVQVELLVKGAFPDACFVLHEVKQERAANLIRVQLQMRKPQGSLCASVLRPYRFYLTLDSTYAPGNYTLRLNDRVHTFVVRDQMVEQNQ